MSVHDAEDGASPVPHSNPPGRWQIARDGVIQWRRQLADGSEAVLPKGRGPLRAGSMPGRWWPDDFRYDPGPPMQRLRQRRPLRPGRRGWPELGTEVAKLTTVSILSDSSWSRLPQGTSQLAVGGHPARPVAFNGATGEAWWWDPAEESWTSLQIVSPASESAWLADCDDGVILVSPGELTWLLADHANGVVSIKDTGFGQPLAPPSRFAGGLVWPALQEARLILWFLQLPPRSGGMADPGRYQARPQRLDFDGPAAAIGIGAGRLVTNGSIACLPTSLGHAELQQWADTRVRAVWHPAPDRWQILPHLPPILRPDGRFELQATNGVQAGRLRAGIGQPSLSDGLHATLGSECWLGKRRVAHDGNHIDIGGPDVASWLLPLLTSPDGGLMLMLPDATEQASLLLNTGRGTQRGELVCVSGNLFERLGHFFDVRSSTDLQSATWRNELVLFDSRDSRNSVLLEGP